MEICLRVFVFVHVCMLVNICVFSPRQAEGILAYLPCLLVCLFALRMYACLTAFRARGGCRVVVVLGPGQSTVALPWMRGD